MTHKPNIEFTDPKEVLSQNINESIDMVKKAFGVTMEEALGTIRYMYSVGTLNNQGLRNYLIGKRGRSKTGKPNSDYSAITSVSITDNDIIIKFKSGYFTGLTSLELE